jgi:1,4-dihydroxy-2-naphthoate octaprenyltransferase
VAEVLLLIKVTNKEGLDINGKRTITTRLGQNSLEMLLNASFFISKYLSIILLLFLIELLIMPALKGLCNQLIQPVYEVERNWSRY